MLTKSDLWTQNAASKLHLERLNLHPTNNPILYCGCPVLVLKPMSVRSLLNLELFVRCFLQQPKDDISVHLFTRLGSHGGAVGLRI